MAKIRKYEEFSIEELNNGLFAKRSNTISATSVEALVACGVGEILIDPCTEPSYYSAEAYKCLEQSNQFGQYANNSTEALNEQLRTIAKIKKAYNLKNDVYAFAMEGKVSDWFKKVWAAIKEAFRKLIQAISNFVKSVMLWGRSQIVKQQEKWLDEHQDDVTEADITNYLKDAKLKIRIPKNDLDTILSTHVMCVSEVASASLTYSNSAPAIAMSALGQDLSKHTDSRLMELYEKISAHVYKMYIKYTELAKQAGAKTEDLKEFEYFSKLIDEASATAKKYKSQAAAAAAAELDSHNKKAEANDKIKDVLNKVLNIGSTKMVNIIVYGEKKLSKKEELDGKKFMERSKKITKGTSKILNAINKSLQTMLKSSSVALKGTDALEKACIKKISSTNVKTSQNEAKLYAAKQAENAQRAGQSKKVISETLDVGERRAKYVSDNMGVYTAIASHMRRANSFIAGIGIGITLEYQKFISTIYRVYKGAYKESKRK